MLTWNRPKIIAGFRVVFYIAVLVCIVLIGKRYWHDIIQQISHPSLPHVAGALVVGVITLFIQALTWWVLISSHHTISMADAYRTYFRSLVARYLPGGVWVLFARTVMTAQLGIPKARVAFLLYIEALLAITSGSLIVLGGGFTVGLPSIGYLLFGVMLLTGTLLLSAPQYLLPIVERLGKKISVASLRGSVIVGAGILMLVSWLGFGISFSLLLSGLMPGIHLSIPAATVAFAASWVVGFVLLFIPSGLGIREAVMVLLLDPIIGFAPALAAAVGFRLLYMLAEVIHFGLTWLRNGHVHPSEPHTDTPRRDRRPEKAG